MPVPLFLRRMRSVMMAMVETGMTRRPPMARDTPKSVSSTSLDAASSPSAPTNDDDDDDDDEI